MTLLVVDDLEALAAEAARRLEAATRAAVTERGRATVALSGGATPARLFDLLADGAAGSARPEVDWPRVHLFWGDERAVPPDHPDSNYRMARERLLDRVGAIPPGNVHRIEAELGAAEAAQRYERTLVTFFDLAPGAFPRFDLVLLGLGGDGHTASLFPGTAALRERAFRVTANTVPQLGTERVTLTYPTLNAAREVLFLVAGADKARALAAALDPAARAEEIPARGVAPADGRLTWLVDRAAAAHLALGETT